MNGSRGLFEPDALARARRSLMRSDPELGAWMKEIGPVELRPRGSHFKALVRAIIAQQLANKAARTVIERMLALFPKPAYPRPEQLLALPDAAIRGAGVSGQKMNYLRCLAEAFDSGHLKRARLSTMNDDEVMEALCAVKGIGRWTAEMFLMFSLGRPDLYSTGDLALTNAMTRVTGIENPTPEDCLERAELWRPWRTVACLYLWRIAHWK